MTSRRSRGKRTQRLTQTPDKGLMVEQFEELNSQFYQTRPHSYLLQRWNSLLLVTCESASVEEATRESLSLGELTLTIGQLRPVDERAIDYAALESTVLLHHASEALFRMYFAHHARPACPWLELSRITSGGEFKTRVQKLLTTLTDQSARAEITTVFRGNPSYSAEHHDCTEAEWNERVEGLCELLTLAGTRLINEAGLYNAAKHGLAVHTGGASLSIGPAGHAVAQVSGPTVSLLGVNRDSARWEKRVKWIDVDQTIALTRLVIREIAAIHTIARLRYTSEAQSEADTVPNLVPASIRALTTATEMARAATLPDGTAISIDGMNMELMYKPASRPMTSDHVITQDEEPRVSDATKNGD